MEDVMTRFIPVSLIVVLAACAHSPPPAPEPKAEPVAQPAPPPAAPFSPPRTPIEVAKPVPPPPTPALAGSVYFAFDKDVLTKASREALQGITSQATAPGARVRVEGNCDERGTVEYNIGLGQRRAEAAKSFLVNLGVQADSIETISWGKEHPKAIGHDPASWRENRRADVFITAPPAVSLR
jgi:peptidoglycan-associated lipoprotein